MRHHPWNRVAAAAAALLVASCAEPVAAPTSPSMRPTPDVAPVGSADVGTTVYAASVVSSSQGPGSGPAPVPIAADRSDPANALGAPDSGAGVIKFFSMGFGGQVVLKFAEPVSGTLAVVYEATFTDPGYPEEKAEVWVSADNVAYTLVGVATNNRSDPLHDIHKSSFTLPAGACVQYVKIVDVTPASNFPGAGADGFDLDAVGIENAVPCQVAAPAGCSPGYYANHDVPGDERTFASWGVTGTGQPAGYTLEDALDSPGGGPTVQAAKNILLRQAAAALLNTTLVPGFPKTTAQVVALVDAALASDARATILALAGELDTLNNLGCGLGNKYPHE